MVGRMFSIVKLNVVGAIPNLDLRDLLNMASMAIIVLIGKEETSAFLCLPMLLLTMTE